MFQNTVATATQLVASGGDHSWTFQGPGILVQGPLAQKGVTFLLKINWKSGAFWPRVTQDQFWTFQGPGIWAQESPGQQGVTFLLKVNWKSGTVLPKLAKDHFWTWPGYHKNGPFAQALASFYRGKFGPWSEWGLFYDGELKIA